MKRRNFITLPVVATVVASNKTAAAKPTNLDLLKSPAEIMFYDGRKSRMPDSNKYNGIGVMWNHNGNYCRSAVLIPANPTIDDVFEAIALLNSAMQNPTPETCVFGELECITGKEQKVTSLQ